MQLLHDITAKDDHMVHSLKNHAIANNTWWG